MDSNTVVKLLMELQYNFPISSYEPICVVAERLGLDCDKAVEELVRLHNEGVVRRLGYYVSPLLTEGKRAALIAFRDADPDKAVTICSDKDVTHCYIRDHPTWNLWIVRRAVDNQELLSWAETAAKLVEAKSFDILPAERLLRLSVKLDLYKGVSRAGPYSKPKPSAKADIDPKLLRSLARLPITRRPYEHLVQTYRLTPEKLTRLLAELVEKGVLLDPGLVLNGRKLGFKYNAMVIVWGVEVSKVCNEIVENVPEATHVVQRYSLLQHSEWAPACYAVIHAREKQAIEAVAGRIYRLDSVERVETLYSVRGLKQEVT